MTAEQLQNARASAWRQTGNALLTADDAANWLREAGLTLFLPRTSQISAPAGSFVEATQGEENAAPGTPAIEAATALLRRLLANGDAVALNLLGLPGDRPDFLATEETLPYIFALRGDREWKRGPRGRSTPLVIEVWKLLTSDGAMTAEAIQHKLGRQLTEAAVLRALADLWTNLRVEPVFDRDGGNQNAEDTKWQLLETKHEAAMQAGSTISQGAAISALISLYLQSAVAATSDEVEAFLSPLASRSRVRDAIRALAATRQLGVRNLGPKEHFFVDGSLPEFAEAPEVAMENEDEAVTEPGDEFDDELLSDDEADAVLDDMLPETETASGLVIEAADDDATDDRIGEGRKRFVAQRQARAQTRDRGSFAAGTRPASSRPAGGRPFHAREPWREDSRPRGGGERRSQPPFGDKRPFVPEDSSERRPVRPRPEGDSGERRPYAREDRPSTGEKRPYTRRSEGGSDERRAPRRDATGPGSRPYTPRTGSKPFERSERPAWRDKSAGADGGTRPPRRNTGGPRSEGTGERRSFRPAGEGFGGDRPARPYRPRTEGAGYSSERKPYTPREGGASSRFGGEKRPYTPRGREQGSDFSAPKRPYKPREDRGGDAPRERRSFTPREGRSDDRPFAPREKRSFTPREDRPYTPRAGRPGTDRPRTSRGESAGGRTYTPRAPREGGYKPRTGGGAPRTGERKPFDGERRPYTRKPEGEARSPRREGAPGAGAPRRFSPDARPSRPGAPASSSGEKRPRTAKFTSTGKPRSGAAATGRPGPRATRAPGSPARPGFGPRKPGTGRPGSGKPGFGARKPGAGPRKGPGGKGPGSKGPRRNG